MKDNDPNTRVLACRAASEEMDNDLAERMLELIRHEEDPEVGAAAAIAFGPALQIYEEDRGIEELDLDLADSWLSEDTAEKILTELKEVYEDTDRPKLLRRRCLEAAVRGTITWQHDATRACSQSDDHEWQLTAVFCMGFLTGFKAHIVEQLENTDKDIKREALKAAGWQCIEEAGRTIMNVAFDPNAEKEHRLAALEELAAVNPRGSRSPLEDLIDEGEDEDIVAMAEYAVEERDSFPIDL